MNLVLPSVEYKQSYLEAYKEFEADGFKNATNYSDVDYEEIERNFEGYVQKLHAQIEGKQLPDGYVPATEFWIIVDDQYIGRVHIRHKLTDYLRNYGGHIGYNICPSARRKGYGTQALSLGLQEAKKIGLDKVLITCDDTNIGSYKIIEKNGGVLAGKVEVGDGMPKKRRYWIELL